MSMSLYYQAIRKEPITDEEKAVCQEIIDRYNAQYPFELLYESFCAYDLNDEIEESDVIFSGATKLPMDWGMEFFSDVVYYWIDCLNEITDALCGTVWHVNLDDTELKWDEESHWHF